MHYLTPVLWPPHAKSWLIGKDSDAGRDGGRRRRGWQRMRWLDGITWVWVNSRSWWWTGRPGVLQFMGSQIVGHNWETELNWTEYPNSIGVLLARKKEVWRMAAGWATKGICHWAELLFQIREAISSWDAEKGFWGSRHKIWANVCQWVEVIRKPVFISTRVKIFQKL